MVISRVSYMKPLPPHAIQCADRIYNNLIDKMQIQTDFGDL